MATFTETLVTSAPSGTTVYARVMVAGVPVVARAAMSALVTVGTDSLWTKDVTWDGSWANPIVVFDDGITVWGSKPALANVVRIEGAALTQVDPVGRNLARVANRQYGTQEIFKNDTYSDDAGGPIEFDRASTTDWPTITDSGWAVKWYLERAANNENGVASLTITTCTIVDANNVDVAMTAAQTDTLGVGQYKYQLRAEHATKGNKTLESGVLTVKPEQVP